MDIPVFKLYLAKWNYEATLVTAERQAEFITQLAQIKKDNGVVDLLNGTIWSDERYAQFGVEKYPNWQALYEYNRCLDELHFFQYLTSQTYVGISDERWPMNLEPVELNPSNPPIAQVWITKNRGSVSGWDEWEKEKASKVFDLDKNLGVRTLVNTYVTPLNESHAWFGVDVYPSMEALLAKSKAQADADWWSYIQGRTYLGVIDGGELVKK
jgi:hypothetical protein